MGLNVVLEVRSLVCAYMTKQRCLTKGHAAAIDRERRTGALTLTCTTLREDSIVAAMMHYRTKASGARGRKLARVVEPSSLSQSLHGWLLELVL